MGASGAGKSTLLDVLAGRKNTGKISGDILINGESIPVESFNKLMGYVEQFDVLPEFRTVSEVIHFSAALRFASA